MFLGGAVLDHLGRPQLKEDETFLMPTVKVLVHSGRYSDYVRGVVAWASQYNVITDKLRRDCNLPLARVAIPLIRTLQGTLIEIVGQSRVIISPHFNEERTDIVDVLVAKKINARMSGDRVHPLARANVSHLQLADPDFDGPGDIDLVLGAPHIPFLMKAGSRSVYGPLCYAKETTLGWVVMGKLPVENTRYGPLPNNLAFL